jgi:galactoside O-acetyltransferase
MRLAGLALRPFKGKSDLLHFLGDRPYISPRAEIACPNLELGPHCLIDDYVTIYAHHRAEGGVYLARDVRIYRWSVVEVGPGNRCLRVGPHTHIQAGCNLNPFVSDIVIGANCLIAPQCALMPYQHGFSDIDRPICKQPLTSRGNIVIKDNVWLGVGAVVTDGVTIGQGTIIGAGAVVTRDIPPYSTAVGVPARVVCSRDPAIPATSPENTSDGG